MTPLDPITVSRALSLLEAHAPPLARGLARRPGLRSILLDRGELAEPLLPARVESLVRAGAKEAESEEGLHRRLRQAKEEVFIRLGLRDLLGLASLEEVLAALTRLAEVCLEETLRTGLRLLLEKKGLGPWPSSQPLFFCVLGAGKLGGRELNYASDVDLIYLFEPRLWPFPDRESSSAEAAAALATFTSRALANPTPDGLVFRVDLDLRPAGKDGPLVPSLEAARNHYLYHAAEWERLALIKLRPVAGNRDLGRELFDDTRPFVFRRHLDYTALEELRSLKAKIAARPSSLTQTGFDLKLDRGGIRQIEFFVQTLQLIFGGRNPGIRSASTLAALKLLESHELIGTKDREELTRAYLFLRRAEHRLQLRALRQTQRLPQTRPGMESLGRAMGYQGHDPAGEFNQDLEVHLELVAGRFESLLGGPSAVVDQRPLAGLVEALETGARERALDILATTGFADPERALESILSLSADTFLPHSLKHQRRLLAQALPALLDRLLRSPEPDRTLIRLEKFLAAIGPKTGLFLLLLENPSTLDLLVRLLSTSAFLTRVLTAHPGLLDSLIGSRSVLAREREELEGELSGLLEAAPDEEERAGLVRRFKAEETLRIAVRDLSGDLTLEVISDQLTDLAEAVLAQTLGLAWANLERRYGQEEMGRVPAFAVLGLGKLGGRELAYHSDLDVIFLFEPGPPAAGGTYTPAELAVKLAQKTISLLSAAMVEGPGYELDTRLRPSGRQGPLVVSLESFIDYHQSSQVWERLALLKARPVAGHPGLGAKGLAAARRAVFDRPLPPDWAREIRRLRAKMGRERSAPEGLDLKMGPGGLVDVEFAAQALQLLHGRRDETLRSPHILKGLTALYEAGHLDEETYRALFDGYRHLRQLDRRLRLIHDRGGDMKGYEARDLRAAGADPAGTERIRRRIESAYTRVMEGF